MGIWNRPTELLVVLAAVAVTAFMIFLFSRTSAASQLMNGRVRALLERWKMAARSGDECAEKYRAFFDASSHAVLLHTREGQILECNSAASSLFGYSPAEMANLSTHDLIVAETAPRITTTEPEEGVRVTISEVTCKHSDGRQFPAELHRRPLNIRGRQVEISYFQDISSRKRTEQTLRETLHQAEALYRFSRATIALENLPAILQAAANSAAEILRTDYAILVILDAENEKIAHFVTGGSGAGQATIPTFQAFMQGISGQVVRAQKSLCLGSMTGPEANSSGSQFGPMLVVPLLYRERLRGTLTVLHRADQPNFTPRDEELLVAIANQTAIAIENIRLFQSERRQREHAETLREVSSILSASLDQQQVLQLILEQLARVVPYDSSSIMLVSEQQLSFVAHRKFRSEKQVFTPLRIESLGHIQEVLEYRRPVIIPDTTQDPRWSQVKYSDYIRCWLGAPLIVQNRVLGLLNLDKVEPGYYGEKDAELAMAFANQAAIAIENASLFESEQRRAQEAETLRQATAAVLSMLNRDEILREILVQLERVVPYDNASIQLLRDGYLEIVHGRGREQAEGAIGTRIPVTVDNPNSIVIEQRQPYILVNASTTHTGAATQQHDRTYSWLGVPMIIHERVIGMLSLDSQNPRFYTSRHAQLASAFAAQVAIAIENARLYATERQRVEELDALRATVADISTELDLPKLLESILKRATSMLSGTGGALGLYETQRKEVRIVVSHNLTTNYTGAYVALGEGAMGRVAQTAEPIIVDDYDRWEKRSPQYEPGQWHAVVAVPLLFGSQLVGVIMVVDNDPERKFTLSDRRLLTLFAQQAAIAVKNARLYQEARDAAGRWAVLYRASHEIAAASLDPEGIYLAIHQAASQLMLTEAFAITLLNEAKGLIDGVFLMDRNGRVHPQSIPSNRGLSHWVIALGKSFHIDDTLQPNGPDLNQLDLFHFGDTAHVRSILAVPMRLGEKVIGMLSAQSYLPYVYTAEHLHLLEMLASYAAVALDNARLFTQVQRLAIIDPVTEVFNRRHLLEMGQREFSRARRFGRPLSVIMLDIDHFKRINDTYGHATGDNVLVGLARQIQHDIREVDILGRYGGEEFTIVLPETDLKSGRAIAERLRKKVEEDLTIANQAPVRVTISVGVATIQNETADITALINRADTAMYAAKNAGRNRVEAR